MEQLASLILSLSRLIPSANIGHFLSIVEGIYSISSGGVTQLNISRYSSISYRSVQRFMSLSISWYQLLIRMLVVHLSNYRGVYLLVIDETVEDKAGKQTDKIGYFFSSKLGKVIKSVSFGVLSLVAVDKRKSYVVDFTQLSQDASKTAENKAKKVLKAKKKAQKKKDKAAGKLTETRPPGRPVGSKNKVKTKVESESSRALTLLLTRVLPFLASVLIHPTYLVGDGAYGNLTYCLLAGEQNLFLISKLNCTSVLFYPPKAGTRQRIYGDKVDFTQLQDHQIDEKEEDDCIFTFFQIKKVRTRNIGQFINVVIIRCYHKKSKKTGFILLFSTDLTLEGMTLVDYYALRFQIEFNFRDAKQYFGLSDFKSIKPTQMNNAVGLSFFMVNLSAILIDNMKEQSDFKFLSILDLKTCFRAIFFSKHLKNTPILNVNNILDPQNIAVLEYLGAINMFNKNNIMPKVD
ncbi:MAG: transposase [Saprospiraceae bacterium]|nr:transposase [Saprospiraceae bacterium]